MTLQIEESSQIKKQKKQSLTLILLGILDSAFILGLSILSLGSEEIFKTLGLLFLFFILGLTTLLVYLLFKNHK